MNSIQSLNGSHLRTYETIFQHPLSHNLEWRAVRSLLKHLGTIDEEANGNLKVTRNGQTLSLHRPHTKEVAAADEVMILRHFLEKSETIPVATDGTNQHCLLVIDHDGARIFHSEIHGAAPQRISPGEYFRHSFKVANFSRGKEKPDPNIFFKSVSEALALTGQILIFGAGTGASNEMDQFVAWLKTHHPEQSGRVVGSLVMNVHPLTNDQLLAKARDFYLNASSLQPTLIEAAPPVPAQ